MTQQDIVDMARQVAKQPDRIYAPDEKEFLYYFAKLVAAKEREASAKELDEISKEAKNVAPNGYVWRTIKECAEVIRARGQA